MSKPFLTIRNADVLTLFAQADDAALSLCAHGTDDEFARGNLTREEGEEIALSDASRLFVDVNPWEVKPETYAAACALARVHFQQTLKGLDENSVAQLIDRVPNDMRAILL